VTAHLLFEEDGVFKAGTALTSTDASHQVELASTCCCAFASHRRPL
jgi:hypothetical protein